MKIVTIIALLLFATVSHAQGIVSGQVVDATGAGVPGITATLRVDNLFPPRFAVSDKDGKFSWTNIHAGAYKVQLSSAIYFFDEPQKAVSLREREEKQLRFWALPLPKEVAFTPPGKLANMDLLTVAYLPKDGEAIGETQHLKGVKCAFLDASVLRIEWQDNRTPTLVPVARLRFVGAVENPPQ